MPRINGATNRMSQFLRSFRNPAGPAPSDWPSPAIFRKWLRRPGFRAAFLAIQQTLRTQTDYLLVAAANRAAVAAHSQSENSPDLATLLRIACSHMNRIPLPEDQKPTPRYTIEEFQKLLRSHHIPRSDQLAAELLQQITGLPPIDNHRRS